MTNSEELKSKLGGIKLPPNTDTIIKLFEKFDRLISETQGALVKISYMTLAEILLFKGDKIGELTKVNDDLENLAYKYDGDFIKLKDIVEANYDEYKDFYGVIDNIDPLNKVTDITNVTYLFLNGLEKMREDGADDVLRNATEARTINEFNRFKR